MSWPGLPVLVKLDRRPMILLGDGEAADAKRRLLERAGAVVVADHPDARLAVVAIEDEAEATAAVAALRARGLLVNAVDRPMLCDFTLPAVVDRAPVLVAVMSGGVSAGLAAALRQRLESVLPATLGRLADALNEARLALRSRFPDAGDRRRAIAAALAPGAWLDPLKAYTGEDVFHPIECGDRTSRFETAVLASSDPDDLTLRQARWLAQADRVFHQPAVPPVILDRARADAARIACDAPPVNPPAGLNVWVEMGA